MRKLFSFYKKRVGRKIKTDKFELEKLAVEEIAVENISDKNISGENISDENIANKNVEGAVSSDTLTDDKTGGSNDRAGVEKISEGDKSTQNKSRIGVAEAQGHGHFQDSVHIQVISGGLAVEDGGHVSGEDEADDDQEIAEACGRNETPVVKRVRAEAGEPAADSDDETDEWRKRSDASNVEEELEEQRSRRSAPQRKRSFSNAAEVIDYIPERVHSLPPRLHENLLGVIAVEVTENNPANVKYRRYIDWRGEKILCSELYEGVADTTVTVSEYVLMEIARGNLNPQIALVSNRVRVAGKVGFGIYFFNLIAPR